MKLTLPTSLGPLVAKHRTGVPKLLRTLAQQSMLKCSPHHRGRSLRPQSTRPITTILEAVHLFADDIGGLTDPTTEQVGCFQERRADLTKAGTTEVLPRLGLDGLPALKGLRKEINHAPKTLELTHVPDARTTSQSAG